MSKTDKERREYYDRYRRSLENNFLKIEGRSRWAPSRWARKDRCPGTGIYKCAICGDGCWSFVCPPTTCRACGTRQCFSGWCQVCGVGIPNSPGFGCGCDHEGCTQAAVAVWPSEYTEWAHGHCYCRDHLADDALSHIEQSLSMRGRVWEEVGDPIDDIDLIDKKPNAEPDHVWQDLHLTWGSDQPNFTFGTWTGIARLPNATAQGRSGVMVRVELPGGRVVLARATLSELRQALRMFEAAERAGNTETEVSR